METIKQHKHGDHYNYLHPETRIHPYLEGGELLLPSLCSECKEQHIEVLEQFRKMIWIELITSMQQCCTICDHDIHYKNQNCIYNYNPLMCPEKNFMDGIIILRRKELRGY